MDKQVFAKVGVFVLLGLNVGAYYVFWPSQQSTAKQEAKELREEKGEVTLLPTKQEIPPPQPKPKEFPVTSLDNVVVLPPPVLPKPAEPILTPDDLKDRLIDHIKKDIDAAVVVLPPPTPNGVDPASFPPLRDDTKPKPLPPLNCELLVKDPNIGATSALTPKTPPSPWSINTEKAGGQIMLKAFRTNPHGGSSISFQILCDRVDQTPDGEVRASGKITFVGARLKGSCERLILPSDGKRILFEEKVELEPLSGQPKYGNFTFDRSLPLEEQYVQGCVLRGERISWDLLPVPPSKKSPEAGPPFLGPPASR